MRDADAASATGSTVGGTGVREPDGLPPVTAQPRFRVVVTDQVFPSVAAETELLAGIGARLQVADGTVAGVAALAAGADALLNTYLPVTDELLALARIPGDLANLIVTPHMAYYSEESIAESQRKAATQVVKVLTGGQPDYPVSA
jgi:hypothetical protein